MSGSDAVRCGWCVSYLWVLLDWNENSFGEFDIFIADDI